MAPKVSEKENFIEKLDFLPNALTTGGTGWVAGLV